MEERGITIEKLVELTGLSERTIGRMRDNANESHTLNTVVAVCVALHLNSYQGNMMLLLAGYTLKNTKKIVCTDFYKHCIIF